MDDAQIKTLVELVAYIASRTGQSPTRLDERRKYGWDEATVELTPGDNAGVVIHLGASNKPSDFQLALQRFCESHTIPHRFG